MKLPRDWVSLSPERDRPPEAEPLQGDGQGRLEGQGQRPQGVVDPLQGRVRRLRPRCRRLPRLDARRRPPVHDPAAAARGQLRRALRPLRARRRLAGCATCPRPTCATSAGWPTRCAAAGATPGSTRSRGTRRSTPSPTAIRTAGGDRTAIYLTSRGITNEVYYAAAKAARAMGVANIDSAARTCHAPVDRRPEADDRRRRVHVLDAGRARDRPDRAVGHQRRQQPARVHEVPLPGPQARGPGRRRQPLPGARAGALLGAVQRRVGAVRHEAVRPPRARPPRGRRRARQRRAPPADRARRRRPRLGRRPHRGLGRAGGPRARASTAPRCWPQPASTTTRSSSSSTCTPGRRLGRARLEHGHHPAHPRRGRRALDRQRRPGPRQRRARRRRADADPRPLRRAGRCRDGRLRDGAPGRRPDRRRARRAVVASAGASTCRATSG